MIENKKIKLEVGKSYLTNTGVILKVAQVIKYGINPDYYVMDLDSYVFTRLFSENGLNLADRNEFVVGEFVPKPVWDWNLCKFAKYIFRNSGKYWFYSFQKPTFHNELKSWIATTALEYGRIPDEFAPVFSGKDEDSLMKRPAGE